MKEELKFSQGIEGKESVSQKSRSTRKSWSCRLVPLMQPLKASLFRFNNREKPRNSYILVINVARVLLAIKGYFGFLFGKYIA